MTTPERRRKSKRWTRLIPLIRRPQRTTRELVPVPVPIKRRVDK